MHMLLILDAILIRGAAILSFFSRTPWLEARPVEAAAAVNHSSSSSMPVVRTVQMKAWKARYRLPPSATSKTMRGASDQLDGAAGAVWRLQAGCSGARLAIESLALFLYP